MLEGEKVAINVNATLMKLIFPTSIRKIIIFIIKELIGKHYPKYIFLHTEHTLILNSFNSRIKNAIELQDHPCSSNYRKPFGVSTSFYALDHLRSKYGNHDPHTFFRKGPGP